MESVGFSIRPASAPDVDAIIRMKAQLAAAENAAFALRWTQADWFREGFGANAGFRIYVADCDEANVGMVIYSERAYTGWREPALYIQDLFVRAEYRRRGIARALLARVAADAVALGSPMIELTMHASNPAREFYRSAGFERVDHCVHYVAAGAGLAVLVGGGDGRSRSPQPNVRAKASTSRAARNGQTSV
jgi:ribosomal protein S18 acetylase RimI-like enzyme